MICTLDGCKADFRDRSQLVAHQQMEHPSYFPQVGRSESFTVCLQKGCQRISAYGSPFCEVEHHNAPQPEPGRKDDALKTRYDLLPWRGLDLVAQVLTKGAEKYAPENWRKVEGWRWRYFRAAIGHLAKWRAGEKLDPEWGLPHLAHAACCVLFLLELDE